jgi:hypothetical protein
VPPIFASLRDDVYGIVDGKQRSLTLSSFANNLFALEGDTPDVQLSSGEKCVVANMYYRDLSGELQNRFKDFRLGITYIEDSTNEEILEAFFRLNNGQPMTKKELSRIRASRLDLIQKVSKHPMIKTALTSDAKNRYTDEDYVWKSWAMLYEKNPSFETSDIRKLMETANISEPRIIEIDALFTRLHEVYNYIPSTRKGSKKAFPRMFRGVHLIGLLSLAKQSIKDNVSIDLFGNWIIGFFTNELTLNVSDAYNSANQTQRNTDENIRIRHQAMMGHYKEFIKGELK